MSTQKAATYNIVKTVAEIEKRINAQIAPIAKRVVAVMIEAGLRDIGSTSALWGDKPLWREYGADRISFEFEASGFAVSCRIGHRVDSCYSIPSTDVYLRAEVDPAGFTVALADYLRTLSSYVDRAERVLADLIRVAEAERATWISAAGPEV